MAQNEGLDLLYLLDVSKTFAIDLLPVELFKNSFRICFKSSILNGSKELLLELDNPISETRVGKLSIR